MNYGTLPSRFLNAVDSLPNPRAQISRGADRWTAISSDELLRRVAALSAALVELGVTVPIYFKESPERMSYILNHSGAKVIFVTGTEQLQKLLAIRPRLPELEHVIVADGAAEPPPECLRYETLIASAGGSEIASYRMRASQVLPGQLASIIYTSGTTGEPKGVMLTHSNFCSNVTDSHSDMELRVGVDIALSFLPLAHVYGRTLDYFYIFHGIPIAYVEVVDLVAQALLELHPTVMGAVPRVFEKIYVRIMEQGSRNTGMKRKIFDWAMEVAKRSWSWRSGESNVSPGVKLQWA